MTVLSGSIFHGKEGLNTPTQDTGLFSKPKNKHPSIGYLDTLKKNMSLVCQLIKQIFNSPQAVKIDFKVPILCDDIH